MSNRAQALLEMASRQTTNPNEALSAIRKLRDHVERHGWGADTSVHIETPTLAALRKVNDAFRAESVRLRSEAKHLRAEAEEMRAEIERLKGDLKEARKPPPSLHDKVREAVASSTTKREAIIKLGWGLNTYSYKRLDAFGFDQGHMLGQAWRRGRKGAHKRAPKVHEHDPNSSAVRAARRLHAALSRFEPSRPVTIRGAVIRYRARTGDYLFTAKKWSALLARQDQAEPFDPTEPGSIACFANADGSGCFSLAFEGARRSFNAWTKAAISRLAEIAPAPTPRPISRSPSPLRSPVRQTPLNGSIGNSA